MQRSVHQKVWRFVWEMSKALLKVKDNELVILWLWLFDTTYLLRIIGKALKFQQMITLNFMVIGMLFFFLVFVLNQQWRKKSTKNGASALKKKFRKKTSKYITRKNKMNVAHSKVNFCRANCQFVHLCGNPHARKRRKAYLLILTFTKQRSNDNKTQCYPDVMINSLVEWSGSIVHYYFLLNIFRLLHICIYIN